MFSENHTIYNVIWKILSSSQARGDNIVQHIHIASWMTKATDTLKIWNTYCFSRAKRITQTHLNVMFIHMLPVLFVTASIFGLQNESGRYFMWIAPSTAGSGASGPFIFFLESLQFLLGCLSTRDCGSGVLIAEEVDGIGGKGQEIPQWSI